MKIITHLIAVGVLVFCGHAGVHAEGRQSVFFQMSRQRLVHQHAYHREHSDVPACAARSARDGACVGALGLILWR